MHPTEKLALDDLIQIRVILISSDLLPAQGNVFLDKTLISQKGGKNDCNQISHKRIETYFHCGSKSDANQNVKHA